MGKPSSPGLAPGLAPGPDPEQALGDSQPMILLEFSIAPLDQGESVSDHVARSLEIVEASGLDYRFHAMGTIVEGDIDEVLAVLKQCHETMAEHCDRITCSAKMDFRRGHRNRLESKTASVETKLGRSLKK